MDEELLKKLKSDLSSFSSVAEALGITSSNASSFWKDLIQLMKDLDAPTTGINTSDENKILNFIQVYCDLPDKETEKFYVSYLYDAIRNVTLGTDTDGDYWNKSVQEIIDNFVNSDDTTLGSSLFTPRHLKNANAGLSFIESPWVEPDFNLDGDHYNEVRGHDEVNDILRNRHKLQYTHTQDQMKIDGKGGYLEYNVKKIYLYPDLNGNGIVSGDKGDNSGILSKEKKEIDSILTLILYDIQQTKKSIFDQAFLGVKTINESYDLIGEYINQGLEEQYTCNDWNTTIIKVNEEILQYTLGDEREELKNYYKYLMNLFGNLTVTNSTLIIFYFIEWCEKNKEAIEKKYNIELNIYNKEGERYFSVEIQPLNSEIFGLIYKDFCEEEGYPSPSLAILNGEPVKNEDALNKWLRLLMPQYGRRVEVEDLNRNFWVIAQVIAGISNFLFDDNSPIFNLFKKLTDEIVQLWENILYLWVEVASNQLGTSEVLTLTVPYSPWEHRLWRKFDDFEIKSNSDNWDYQGFVLDEENKEFELNKIKNDQNQSSTTIEQFVKEYAKQYPNKNLIIIPFIRENNYRQNFYSCEYYPSIWCYHCGTQKWKEYKLKMNLYNGIDDEWGSGIDPKNYVISGCPISIGTIEDGRVEDYFYYNNIHGKPYTIWESSNLHKIKNYIGGFSIEKDGYSTYSPYTSAPSTMDEETVYYGAIRCVPNIQYEITLDEIKITDFKIDIYDASSTLDIEGGYIGDCVATVKVNNQSTVFGSKTGIVEGEDYSSIYTYIAYNTNEAGTKDLTKISCINAKTTHKALYMGEIVSYYADEN